MPVRFCIDCQNMLYPREDPAAKVNIDNRRLVYVCRNCGHQEAGIDSSVPVYRNVLVHSADEKLRSQLLYDVASDPALARTYDVKCKECDGTEAVYYQSPVGKNDEALVLVFVCTNRDCKNVWLSSD